MAEELAGIGPPPCLVAERLGQRWADPGIAQQGVGAAVDDGEEIGGVEHAVVAVGAEMADGEAGAADQRRQPVDDQRVVDDGGDAGFGCGLQRIGRAVGHVGGGIVGIEDRQLAAGTQHPRRLGQRLFRAGDVAERGVEDHGVEVAVGEGQGAGVAEMEFDAGVLAAEPAGVLQQSRRRVDADRPRHRLETGDRAGDRAGAAADFQDMGALGQRQVGEIARAQRLLAGVGGAQFQHLGDPFDHRRLGLGDRGVDIGHGNPPF